MAVREILSVPVRSIVAMAKLVDAFNSLSSQDGRVYFRCKDTSFIPSRDQNSIYHCIRGRHHVLPLSLYSRYFLPLKFVQSTIHMSIWYGWTPYNNYDEAMALFITQGLKNMKERTLKHRGGGRRAQALLRVIMMETWNDAPPLQMSS